MSKYTHCPKQKKWLGSEPGLSWLTPSLLPPLAESSQERPRTNPLSAQLVAFIGLSPKETPFKVMSMASTRAEADLGELVRRTSEKLLSSESGKEKVPV